VAGPTARAPRVGTGDPSCRRDSRNLWENWLRDNARVDWERLARDPCRPGLLLVAARDHVLLLGCAGKPAWRVKVEGLASDVHLLPGNRFLIVDRSGEKSRVYERDLAGKVFWEYRSQRNEDDILACQRLPNGNTFLVTEEGLSEV